MANRIPWQSDGDREYFVINSTEYQCEVDCDNAMIFTHPEQHRRLDHIFIQIDPDENRGFFCWRALVDKALGEAAFDEMTEEMMEHGIEVFYSEEPEKSDIEQWEQYHKQEYKPDSLIETIVIRSLKNFDAAWKYYSEEWT